MALVDALHTCSEGGSAFHDRGRAALVRLEAMPAPSIRVSAYAGLREPVVEYVPTNDDRITTRLNRISGLADATIEQQLRVIPKLRGRRPRHGPCATPEETVVEFTWSGDLPREESAALRRLCREIPRLGRSSSLVRVWVEDVRRPSNLAPVDGNGDVRLRVPSPGRLRMLESAHGLEVETPPPIARTHAYRWVSRSRRRSRLEDRNRMLVLRQTGGDRVRLFDTLSLMRAIRGTLLARCTTRPLPTWISGHEPDGRPARSEHVALLPLTRPAVDGGTVIVGVLVTGPNSLSDEEWLDAITPAFVAEGTRSLHVRGAGFECELAIEEHPSGALERSLASVRGGDFGSRRWASITPVALDRHGRGRLADEETIRLCCRNAGLPTPVGVQATRRSPLPEAIAAARMPTLVRRDGTRRRQVHVMLEFESPIRGPIRLGAGRFLGYGVCHAHRSASEDLSPGPMDEGRGDRRHRRESR